MTVDPELYEKIGALGEGIRALSRQVDEQAKRSDDGRKRLYDQNDELKAAVAKVQSGLNDVERRLSVVEPLALSYGDMKGKWKAIIAFLVAVWLLVGGLVTKGIEWIAAAIARLLAGP